MLTASVTVEVDAEDATIRVLPERALELELAALEGAGIDGIEALRKLQASLRVDPADAWTAEERLAVRRQIMAPLGVDAQLSDARSRPTATDVPTLSDAWVLMLRKRPLRQERFYDELADKLHDEQFLPEALASVVADRDRVDAALVSMGREISADDGSANRLMMPLPANTEQERIARQLATSRGVTVQGPPGTGKSHTIVNLVSHLVAQGKRVLVTAEKEQALSVLREKIPEELRDLSIAVLGSTPSAMEDLRGAAQSMQDSLSAIDVTREERRIAELGARIDSLRDSLRRLDASLVEALQSEQQELDIPGGRARAPQVAEWLADGRELDVIDEAVPADSVAPLDEAEFQELCDILRRVDLADADAAIRELPTVDWLPSAESLRGSLTRLDQLRTSVTALEDRGLRTEGVDERPLPDLRQEAAAAREQGDLLETLGGEWEARLGGFARAGDPTATWVMDHSAGVRERLAVARALANELAGHAVVVPDGDPVALMGFVEQWSARVDAGKKLSMFASKEIKEFAAAVRVDEYAATTAAHLALVRRQIELGQVQREAHRLMVQALGPAGIPVPPLDGAFLFTAEAMVARVGRVHHWWTATYPELSKRLRMLVTDADPAGSVAALRNTAALIEGAAARLEERRLTSELAVLGSRVQGARADSTASVLWGDLASALELANADAWGAALSEAQRLPAIRDGVLRAETLVQRIATGGAPRWARRIQDSRGERVVTGEAADLAVAWQRAAARSWLRSLHAANDIEPLMDRSHADSSELQRVIVDAASRSARVNLKRNLKDRQRRALEAWLTAVKRVGKGTGKNAPRFQAAAREALPAAMGAVPIWIMPMHRVMENFDPRVSDLFDVVVVDESSQCDLLSLGVLALGKKSVVVGDDKQTTPERVGVVTDRIAALQDQYLSGLADARLLTVDESLYSISGRAFPSTIALREHFRCVPEIIEFSNRYYNGAIRPLREVGVPAIGDPLRTVRLEGAISVDIGKGRTNVDEAKAIAEQVAACIGDDAYRGLTFGVVTMMSGPQAQIIQDEIRDRIGDEEFERRRLRVGNPPLFQGDERNVMFVSMVAHDASFAATAPRYAQWANVAASRARDQLWVFHSMDPATLNHQDQRRAMIDYAASYGKRGESEELFALTDSKFERDVLKQMLQRGYDVTAQHRVGSYRIDFVVTVAQGERLAIECDGDSFHGPDKWQDDVRRQRVLERLGWSFWRIRASAYYLDPEAAMQPLWTKLEAMKERAAEAEEHTRARQAATEAKQLEALRQKQAREQVDTTSGEDVAQADPATSSAERWQLDDASPDSQLDALAAEVDAIFDEPRTTPIRSGQAEHAALGTPVVDPSDVRRWARENRIPVGERGRIPGHVTEAFIAAQRVREPWTVAATDAMVAAEELTDAIEPDEVRLNAGANAAPLQSDIDRAWKSGSIYMLGTHGDLVHRETGESVLELLERHRAGALRDRMFAMRPNGGRFKVGFGGLVVTWLDDGPVFVCWASEFGWKPAKG